MPSGRSRRLKRSLGGAMVELALVSLLLYLIVATTLELGRATFSAQVVEDAARVGAREAALTAGPADTTFEAQFYDAALAGNLNSPYRKKVFDRRWLVIDLSTVPVVGGSYDYDQLPLPVVNRQLLPIMIPTTIGAGQYLVYPGAVCQNPDEDPVRDGGGAVEKGQTQNPLLTVAVPIVTSRDNADGTGEHVTFANVVEEVRGDASDPTHGPFSLRDRSADPAPFDQVTPGLVALRINMPFQSVALTGFVTSGPPRWISADDGSATNDGAPPPGAIVPIAAPLAPYAGDWGLGKQGAFAEEVRPFGQVLQLQAIFRREVFQ